MEQPNKQTMNELMSVKKPCILKYVKRKTKANFADFFFFLIWYLKLENGTLIIIKIYVYM